MKSIPLNALVQCRDGVGGESVRVIIDPKTRMVTHFVVKEEAPPHTERLVPEDKVANTTADTITLDCSKQELTEFEPFMLTEYRTVEVPRYAGTDYQSSAYYMPEIITVDVNTPQIPAGLLDVGLGTKVEASDGKIGEVMQLISDSDSGDITHFMVRSGNIWGHKEIVLPVSVVENVLDDTVYLKLSKQDIASMLAIPVAQSKGETDIELLILTFDQAETAAKALQALKQAVKQKTVEILNAATLTKDADGKSSIKEIEDIDKGQGTLFGAVTGGIVGLLGGPIGVIVGAAAGAAAGRSAANWIDMGFPDEYLKKMEAELKAGTSALIVLTKTAAADNVSATLADFGGAPLRQNLTESMVASLAAADDA